MGHRPQELDQRKEAKHGVGSCLLRQKAGFAPALPDPVVAAVVV